MSNGFIFGQMFMIPPITRCMILAIGIVNLLVCLEVISPYSLYYSPLFLKKFEVWRVVTPFMYFGRPTLDVFMHIIFLYRYSCMLESGCRGISEYFWLIAVISGALFAISNIYRIPMLGASFSATITYIWTKRNPRAMVQIFGFISFPAFYLPFILPGFTLISRKSVSIDDVLGIFVGHLFYYFKDVYPRWGKDVLRTPCFIKRLFDEHPKECCKSRRGTTIKEGRIRAEKMKNSTSELKGKPIDDANGIKAVSISHEETTANNIVLDKTAGIINAETAITQGVQSDAVESIASTPLIKTVDSEEDGLVASTEAALDIDPNGSKPALNEPSNSKEESEDGWDDKWGMESNDESSK
jgi:Derlin-2/3